MSDQNSIEIHLVQAVDHNGNRRDGAQVSTKVTLRAYVVYSKVYGPQAELVTGGCRGGFSAGELIAFLYAYPFPMSEWSDRVNEAFNGMKNL